MVHGGEGHAAHFSGTERCASIWACPVCSAVIRNERSADIEQAIKAHQAAGGGLTMVTLTMRHNRGDPLKVTLDAALTAYRRLMQGRAWSDFKAYNGIVGWVRAVEVTYGENGWHPHIHALFFTEKPIVERRASEWSSWLYGRWARYVVERGGKMPNRLHGVDVRIADRGGLVVGQYLAKIQEKAEKAPTKLAAEMARFDFKTGRGAGLMPFELLDSERWADVDDSDSVAARALWVEYVKATRGRRAITWSKGLRDRLALDEELTDEQVIEETESAPPLFVIPRRRYDSIKNQPAILTSLLELVEGSFFDEAFALGEGFIPGELIDRRTGEITPWHGNWRPEPLPPALATDRPNP